jgi:hypothetical protein
MDPKLYEAINQAVAAGVTLNNLITLAMLLVLTVGGGFIAAYIKRKAETLATRQDFRLLQQQLEENTRLTEGIRQEFSKDYSTWASKREFRQRQIQEFYGPALYLIQRKNWIQNQMDQRMKRSEEDHNGEQTAEWAEILKFFYDNHILPLRSDLSECFKSKSFLMEEEPESFQQFLRHDAEERPLYELWRKQAIDGVNPATPWPGTLEDDVRRMKEHLEAEVRKEIGMMPILRRAADTPKNGRTPVASEATLE